MNIIKKHIELKKEKEIQHSLYTNNFKELDLDISNVFIEHAMTHSELLNNCRDMVVVSDHSRHRVMNIDFMEYTTREERVEAINSMTVVNLNAAEIIIEVDRDRHLHEYSSHIGRQMARIIDSMTDRELYYSTNVVLAEDIQAINTIDVFSGRDIVRIRFYVGIV